VKAVTVAKQVRVAFAKIIETTEASWCQGISDDGRVTTTNGS
jgi:hypothetical protein